MGGDTDSHAGTVSTVAWKGINIGRNTVNMDLFTVAHAVGYVDMRDKGNTGIQQGPSASAGTAKIGYNLVTRRGWSPNRFWDLEV